MKTRYRTYPVIALLFALAGCAIPAPQPPGVPTEPLGQQLQALPGAVVDADGLAFSYPGETLYSSGSALPLPGGMAMLEPLIALLHEARGYHARIRVRAGGDDVEYGRQLAEKRAELLAKVFYNRGLQEQRVELMVADDSGPPLEVKLQPSSSDGENR